MFHDLGLTQRYRSSALRFEVDSANAARQFLLDRGVDKAGANRVWLAITACAAPSARLTLMYFSISTRRSFGMTSSASS